MPAPRRLLAFALAAPLLLASCTTDGGDSDGGGSGNSGGGSDGDLSVTVVTHGSAGDAFWDVVQKGALAEPWVTTANCRSPSAAPPPPLDRKSVV